VAHNPDDSAWLLDLWSAYNRSLFRKQLRPPLLAITDDETRLGLWSASDRTISISRAALRRDDPAFVLDVLRHEMVHQYVSEVLRATDETPHGPAFRRVAAQVGAIIDAESAPSEEQTPALRRARKLLALAGSPNRAEAEAAMAAARRIMAREARDVSDAATSPEMLSARLGAPTGRRSAWAIALSSLLVRHFQVFGIWITVPAAGRASPPRVFEILGRPADVTFAAWVHDFLTATADRLWRAHRRETGLTSDAERQRFLAGVMLGFSDKLHEQDAGFAAEGLVVARAAEVDAFARARYPHVRSGRAGSVRGTKGFRDGRAAGRTIVLNRPVTTNAGAQGKLLPTR
jgi:hypothetical protein